MITKFVGGNTINQVLKIANQKLIQNKIPIINYISENNKYDQLRIYNEYSNLMKHIDNRFMIASKLSSFNFNRFYCYMLADMCIQKKVKLIIDAEDSKNNSIYRNISNYMLYRYNNNNLNIIKTYQMYRKDSLDELSDDIKFFKNKKNSFFSPKLVRGAYWNEEKNNDQLFINKEDTDYSYNQAIIKCYENKIPNTILATHNKFSIDLGLLLDKENKYFQYAHLMGMNESLMNKKNMEKKLIYIPYGNYKETIPYLTRRLYENIDSIKYITK